MRQTRDPRDMGIVDPSPDETIGGGGADEGSATIVKKLMNLETSENLLLDHAPRIEGESLTSSGSRVETA